MIGVDSSSTVKPEAHPGVFAAPWLFQYLQKSVPVLKCMDARLQRVIIARRPGSRAAAARRIGFRIVSAAIVVQSTDAVRFGWLAGLH